MTTKKEATETEPPKNASPKETAKDGKSGCAKSFIMDERGEMDKLCETNEDPTQEYVQPRKEKEAGGEGGGGG